jgi:hypothetical protein
MPVCARFALWALKVLTSSLRLAEVIAAPVETGAASHYSFVPIFAFFIFPGRRAHDLIKTRSESLIFILRISQVAL